MLGKEKRRKVRSDNLWHRASYIFVYNSNAQYYVQKRSTKKDYCPSYFDLATGGVVGGDESDKENAERELQEEIGAAGVHLNACGTFKFEDAKNRVWGNMYTC